MTDTANRKKWIVDEPAAETVRRIFVLCVAGNGPMRISKILREEMRLTATAHVATVKGKTLPDSPYNWDDSAIVKILERMEYCGHTVNFKTFQKSHKLKKRYDNPVENQKIFRDTHEAIVSEVLWARVQELRQNKRRLTKGARQGLFSGLLFCADCGGKLHFATCKRFNGKQDHYVCGNYKSNMGSCTAHYIREDALKAIALGRIFDVTALMIDNAHAFLDLIRKQRFDEQEKAIKKQRREVEQAKKRIAELDRIFKRIYEDDINGAISHERFLKLSAEYETEQRELMSKAAQVQQEIDTYEQDKADFSSFSAVVRKYVGIKELTPTIVNELVKRINVHAPISVDGKRVQKVDIIFNFIGAVDLSSEPQTPPKESSR